MHPTQSLSARASAFLQRAAMTPRPRPDRAHAVALVAAQGLPVFPALPEFEGALGGLRLEAPGGPVVLGLSEMHAEDPDLRAGADDTRVVVGRQGEWTTISMSADGRLWAHGPDDAPWALAASPLAFLEQLALRAAISEWCADPFHVATDPVGEEIAAALGLRRDEVASDDHLVAFLDDSCRVLQWLRGSPYHTGFAGLLFPDLERAAAGLRRLAHARPGLSVAVAGGEKSTIEEFARDGCAAPGRVPAIDAWAGESSAMRFRYLGNEAVHLGSPEADGVVWVFGAAGESRIEQLVWSGACAGEGVIQWSSFAPGLARRRRYLPVAPPRSTAGGD
ncbi:MAG: hypothetical protein MUE73_21990 [Planctomycetes bacterium]|nr:hypothetical protein [Planctomycetota bacterium]